MDKAELIKLYKTARENLSNRIRQVPENKWDNVPINEKMTMKDILFHINWFDQEMIQVLESRKFQGSPWWDLSTDERNERIQNLAESQNWLETYQVYQENGPRLLKALENLKEEAVNDPGFFEDMPDDWEPWFILAGNTYDHYDHHARDIEEYLRTHDQ